MIAIPKFTAPPVKREHSRVEAWRTQDEIEFIDRIGSLSDHGMNLGRRVMLNRYEIAIERRVAWRQIDKTDVLAHLAACKKRMAT